MFRWLATRVDPFPPLTDLAPPAGPWRFLAVELAPFRAVFAASLALSAVAAMLEVWLIGYAGRLVDALAATPRAALWTAHGAELTLAAALLLLRPLLALAREGLDDVAFRANAVTLIRWRAHRHVLRQSVGWFQRDLAGRIATQVREIGTAGAGAAYQVVHTLAYVAAYVAASVWLAASIDPRLVLPLALWAALYLGLVAVALPRFRDASADFQAALAELTGMLVDTYANISTVKLFADPPLAEGRDRFETTQSTFVRVQRLEVAINVGMILIGSLLLLGLVGQSLRLWQAGAAPLGLIAVAVALGFRIAAMAEWLLDALSGLFGYLGNLRQALATVAQPVDLPDPPEAPDLVVSGGGIRLTEVSHHHGRGAGGLDRVSLSVAPGEKVALVGPSGAGKSTLVALVLRFYAPEAGRIAIDGQDIAGVTEASLRRAISVVTQEPALLHRSVRDNIAGGRPGATPAEIAAAARRAVADGFIAGLADAEGRHGYDAHVGERGVRLSGGQRQRIALARAILTDAPILILDEATSALDSEVEAAIQDGLEPLMAGRTVIAIAHRLSTIARMDRIVVLDQGRIVEEGTHAALLARGGLYARLWARQAGGFIGSGQEAG